MMEIKAFQNLKKRVFDYKKENKKMTLEEIVISHFPENVYCSQAQYNELVNRASSYENRICKTLDNLNFLGDCVLKPLFDKEVDMENKKASSKWYMNKYKTAKHTAELMYDKIEEDYCDILIEKEKALSFLENKIMKESDYLR